LGRADAAFAKEVFEGNLGEIAMGRLALERGVSPAVISYGERLISDHQLLNDELKAVLAGTTLTLPTELTAGQRSHLDSLRALPRLEFDEAFAAHMIKGHEHMVALFKSQSRSAQLTALRDFALAGTPMLETHLRQARELTKTTTSAR
jgi:putative membrane protein